MRISHIVVGLAVLCLFFRGAGVFEPTNEKIKLKRNENAKTADSVPIQIAVVWTMHDQKGGFLDGVRMAAKEIEQEGGIRGRQLQLHFYDETNEKDSREVARRIARNTRIVAVIGHQNSLFALPASVTYDAVGLLYISPVSTIPSLTSHGFKTTFRLIPSDNVFAHWIASQAPLLGMRHVGIVNVREPYGMSFASYFRQTVEEKGVRVAFERSYDALEKDFRPLIAELRTFNFDHILVADVSPRGALFIKQMREMGITERILVGDGMDSPDFTHLVGDAGKNTLIASIFDQNSEDSTSRKFVDKFKRVYGCMPDLDAAQGYDCVKLLVYAYQESKTTAPLSVATTLKHSGKFYLTGGPLSFSLSGDVIGRPIFFKDNLLQRFTLNNPQQDTTLCP